MDKIVTLNLATGPVPFVVRSVADTGAVCELGALLVRSAWEKRARRVGNPLAGEVGRERVVREVGEAVA